MTGLLESSLENNLLKQLILFLQILQKGMVVILKKDII